VQLGVQHESPFDAERGEHRWPNARRDGVEVLPDEVREKGEFEGVEEESGGGLRAEEEEGAGAEEGEEPGGRGHGGGP